MAKPKVISTSGLKNSKDSMSSGAEIHEEVQQTPKKDQPGYSLKNIWIVSLILKALLVVGYHSTDFDVHRNWLAITHNLHISKWYIENTSQWTLDYPPFFAYFEWFLSQMVPDFVAKDGCLDIMEKGNYGLPTIYFQRLTVIVSELVLFYALQWMIDSGPNFPAKRRTYVAVGSLALSPGLLIIDHIHFQYNGMIMPLSKYPLQRIFQFAPELLENEELLRSSTRGIVGDIEFFILPKITPTLTFLLTLFYQIMSLIPLFIQPNYRRFIGALTLCGYASFLFGWHVHEKAILIVIFPMTLLVARDRKLLAPYSLLVSCGYGSLFPLIYTSNEWLLKVLYTLLWYIIFYFNLKKVVPIPKKLEVTGGGGIILDRVINGYILGFVAVVTFTSLLDLLETRYTILQKLKFLNLMIYSVYCGVGIISSWNGFSWLYFVDESIWNGDDV
ncbi:Dolichyl pyrophosphate Glc1Man9GlcNAc2 alpha-13-glucosyltransferase [Spathaspora sp. JA1]|nr:Dolichyl pyrophosphate Glc1Man9GlcNAc2 alpha-13-glucosyltransferase [Spathaspora sp. JA1]